MYVVYSALIVLFFVVMSPYLLYQAVRYRKYVTSLPQRLGILPVSFNLDGDESIWIHAVSVGEVLTARALLQELLEAATAREIVYTHRWVPGDLVMWDNRCVLHRGRPWDESRYRRVMHRTTVAGDGPTAADVGADLAVTPARDTDVARGRAQLEFATPSGS